MLIQTVHQFARSIAACFAFVALLVTIGGCRSVQQQSFATEQDAVAALASALRPQVNKDRLLEVLGPDIEDALPSGDQVADSVAIEEFLEKYDEGHRIVDGPNNTRIIEVGEDNWPFSFPLIQSDGKFKFDSAAGLEELDNRRIGANELDTIQTCLAVVDAQREYAIMDPDRNGLNDYAAKFISDKGTRNGLFWPPVDGEPLSPLGELIGRAAAQGYERGSGVYHGYRYKMLFAQGPGAPDGSFDYKVRGYLLGGFAMIAWPAEYDRSGIKSFMTNHDGVVYEKDLGENTNANIDAINTFDPTGWTKLSN